MKMSTMVKTDSSNESDEDIYQQQSEEESTKWGRRGHNSKFPSYVKDKDIPAGPIKGMRFAKGSVGAMILRKEDGSQIIEKFLPWTFSRDSDNRVAWAIFTIRQGPGKLKLMPKKIKRLFNVELAAPTFSGYFSFFDAATYEQIPFSNDKDLIGLMHKLDREITTTTQGLILTNTEAERLKKKGTFFEKFGPQIMLFIAIIFLAIALIELGSDITGVGGQVAALGSELNKLNALSNIVPSSLPAT